MWDILLVRRNIYLCFFVISWFISLNKTNAQENIKVVVTDSLKSPIPDVYILFINSEGKHILTSNEKGEAIFSTPMLASDGFFSIKLQHLSFFSSVFNFSITNKQISSEQRQATGKCDIFWEPEMLVFRVFLSKKSKNLEEVVVTAKEKGHFTAVSVIEKEAMQHVQPSSFSDLLSLLPGGIVKNPVLNFKNSIRLREVGISSSDYSIGALGTLFLIDEVPIHTGSNMQKTIGGEFTLTPGSWYADSKRNHSRSGVDMRSIPTDDIEKIEIVRGVPSVKYGDLSSGLVKIIRKKGKTPCRFRIKTDGFSRLFYLGKGFEFKKKEITLNLSLDYLHAKPDPRNVFENYKRYTGSIRIEKKFLSLNNPIKWRVNLDYTGSIDHEKTDPDIIGRKEEYYKSGYNKIKLSNYLDINFTQSIFKSLNFKFSYTGSKDLIQQRKWVQISTASALAVHRKAGEYYGIFVKPTYLSQLSIEGKPSYFFANIFADLSYNFKNITHNFTFGTTYTSSKNNGRGQVYNLHYPPSPAMSVRPRAFSDIPAMQDISAYAESVINWILKPGIDISLRAGFRTLSLRGLPDRYFMSKKTYFTPRINLKFGFLPLPVRGKQLRLSARVAWGKHAKTPTQAMLYPQDTYYDFIQLNYYHNNPKYRQVHFKTYIFSNTNYKIAPAVNTKKEIGIDLKYCENSLSVTYFSEKMSSGFRKMYDFSPVTFKKYDTSNLEHSEISSAPRVENLPYQPKKRTVLFEKESNGSAIEKQGFEFQFLGKRIEKINTRLTLNGAWFKTKYFNSLPVLRFPEVSIINGRKHYNLGLYRDKDSYIRTQFYSSAIADIYFPLLGLKTSLTADFEWYFSKKQAPQNGTPTHYIDENGVKHQYGKEAASDQVLQHLNIVYNPKAYKTHKTPFSTKIHLKITKDFYEKINISMYVNGLFSFYKNKYVNGKKIVRKSRFPPYFGMEMNFSF